MIELEVDHFDLSVGLLCHRSTVLGYYVLSGRVPGMRKVATVVF